MHIILSLVASSVLLTDPAASTFTDATETHLATRDAVARNSMSAVVADLDGDGLLDLVVPQEFLANKLLRNVGEGRFEDISSRLPPLDPGAFPSGPPAHDSEDVAVADFNGDGVLDLIFVSEDDVKMGRTNVHEHYRGLAAGGFERIWDALPDTEADAVAHADLNGDGAPDLLIAGAGQDRLLMNDGKGGFVDETSRRLPREAATAQDAKFVDIDADSDLDLVLALEGGHALWINDGRGVFADETSRRLPFIGAHVEARKVAFADVNGDGHGDLYFCHVGWMSRAPQDALYLNDGKGVFTDVTGGWLPKEEDTTVDAQFLDLDGDGDLDVVRANLGPLTVWENTGASFVDATERFLPAPIEAQILGVAPADFNNDGAIDLYIACLAGPNKDARSFDRLLLGVARP